MNHAVFWVTPQVAMQFPRGNTIAVTGNHPHCRKPLVQTERGVFEDCPDLDGELSLRVPSPALEHPAGSNEANILGTTSGANRNGSVQRWAAR